MFLVRSVYAQCPVCIVTVGGGMLLAKKLGIDDLLVSIWISALDTAISFWLASKFKNRFLRNPLLLSLIMYGFTLFYFQYTGQMGHVGNRLFGIDKILLGQTLGLIAMVIGNFTYLYTKKNNGGRTLFPYAKVVFPVVLVVVTTVIFKFAFHLK
ncbi:hypothetical protein M1116_04155 [Patescibacteria group bacterium]|nr:hypothetical protein [Patescibacteria group bacterium]